MPPTLRRRSKKHGLWREPEMYLKGGNMLHINHLLDEVIRVIFSFLDISGKLAVSLVCKRWLRLVDDAALLDEILLVPRYWEFGGEMVCLSRKFPNIKFCNFDITCDFLSGLHGFTRNIKVLHLYSCDVTEELSLPSIEWPSLKELKIDHMKPVNIFNSLTSLETLTLKGVEGLNDHYFAYLSNLISGLKSLHLELSLDLNMSRSNDDGDFLVYNADLERSLTKLAPLHFINRNRETLIEVMISECKPLYNAILQLKELKLRKLFLHGRCLYDSSLPSVVNILRKFSTVTDLGLIRIPANLGDVPIHSLLPNLRGLTIVHPEHINLKHFFQLKHLQSLSIEFDDPTGSETFDEAVRVYQINKLKSFKLHCRGVKVATLRDLLSKMTELNSLCIWCDGLNNDTLRFVSEHLVQLRCLKIDSAGCLRVIIQPPKEVLLFIGWIHFRKSRGRYGSFIPPSPM